MCGFQAASGGSGTVSDPAHDSCLTVALQLIPGQGQNFLGVWQ